MTGTFQDNMSDLSRQVGHGTLEMRLIVDQVYAKYQELREDLRHPRGGQAHYLRDGLFDYLNEYMQMLAKDVIVPSGSLIERGARNVVHAMDDHLGHMAPVELYDLRRSGHCIVTSDGAVVYERQPTVPRLDRAALRHKRTHPVSYEGRTTYHHINFPNHPRVHDYRQRPGS